MKILASRGSSAHDLGAETPGRWDTMTSMNHQALKSLQEAIRIAGPSMLDLLVELTVIVPEEWILEVIQDLESRSCSCRPYSINNGYYVIAAALPLRQSFGYHTRLETISQGTASFSMRLSSQPKEQGRLYPEIASSCGF